MGTMPPFGLPCKHRVVVDRRLTWGPEILFNRGSHREAIRVWHRDPHFTAPPSAGRGRGFLRLQHVQNAPTAFKCATTRHVNDSRADTNLSAFLKQIRSQRTADDSTRRASDFLTIAGGRHSAGFATSNDRERLHLVFLQGLGPHQSPGGRTSERRQAGRRYRDIPALDCCGRPVSVDRTVRRRAGPTDRCRH